MHLRDQNLCLGAAIRGGQLLPQVKLAATCEVLWPWQGIQGLYFAGRRRRSPVTCVALCRGKGTIFAGKLGSASNLFGVKLIKNNHTVHSFLMLFTLASITLNSGLKLDHNSDCHMNLLRAPTHGKTGNSPHPATYTSLCWAWKSRCRPISTSTAIPNENWKTQREAACQFEDKRGVVAVTIKEPPSCFWQYQNCVRPWCR